MAKRVRRSEFGTITKKKTRFYAEYTGPDLARHTPGHSFRSWGDARSWLDGERRLIDDRTWISPKERKIREENAAQTVGEWLEEYHAILSTRHDAPRKSTMQTYMSNVSNRILSPVGAGASDPRITRLKDIPLSRLTKADVYSWWDGCQAAYAPRGRVVTQKAYKRLRAACEEAVRREKISKNPVDIREATRRIETTPAKHYLPTDAEIDAIIKATPERYKAVTSLCLHHGLRIGEALALETRHVVVDESDPEQARVSVIIEQNIQRITVDGHVRMELQPPKTQSGRRTVPILASDVPIILSQLAKAEKSARVQLHQGSSLTQPLQLLTTTAQGRVVMDTSLRSTMSRAIEAAGACKSITPHSGRRWLITRLAERGAHLKEIGNLLGQSDFETILKVYMQVRAGRTDSLMELVDQSLKGSMIK